MPVAEALELLTLPKGFPRWRDLLDKLPEKGQVAFIENLTDRQRIALFEIIHGEQVTGASTSIYPYIELAMPGIAPALHHKFILDKLIQISTVPRGRLMIFAPPGSAKSTYASVLFPSYYMGLNKACNMIGASHTEDLAIHFSRKCRDLVGLDEFREVFNFGLSRTHNSAKQWETEAGGEFFAVGIGGSVTGRRADGGLIDDPVKSRKDSLSPAYRSMCWDWYTSDFRTRLKPLAFIVIIMTRWHPDDLAGRILVADRDSPDYYDGRSGIYWDREHAEQWQVINLPYEAEEGDILGRPLGTRLWPEWFTAEHHVAEKLEQGAFNWASLFQGRPVPKEGGTFNREWFDVVGGVPPAIKSKTVRRWDLAASVPSNKNMDPDYTAGVKMTLADGQMYIEHVAHFRKTPLKTKMTLRELAEADGRKVKIRAEQEPGSAGKFVIADIQVTLAGFHFRGIPSTGSKVERADPFASAAEAGNVHLVRGPWNSKLLDELESFPLGIHDDMTDACSGAYEDLVGKGKRAGTWGRG